jgi:type VI secretion system secreted protein Hcp
VSVSSFNIMKKTDGASPMLFLTCCQGDHYATAVVTLNKAAGKSPIDFLKYEFEEVYVDNITWSGSSGGDDSPMESVSFSFGKVSITYTPQKPDGSKGSPAVGAWDLTLVSA